MLLKLFRALMPQDDIFVSRFSAHAAKGVEAAKAFDAILSALDVSVDGTQDGRRQAELHYAELRDIEHAADEIARETAQAIHRVFVTPFDRPDILALSTALDDVIDLMKAAGYRILLYQVAITPEMRQMALCITHACAQLEHGVPLLANVSANAQKLKEVCDLVRVIENTADAALDAGLRTLFSGPLSPGGKLTAERVYDLIEEVVDRCEDLVDVIEGIVIEQV